MQRLRWSLTSAEQRRTAALGLVAVFSLGELNALFSSSYNGMCFKVRISCHSLKVYFRKESLVPRRKKECKIFVDLQFSGSLFTVVPKITIVKWLVAFAVPYVYFHISIFSTHRKYEQLLKKHFSLDTKPHFEYLSEFLLIQTHRLFIWPFLL